MAELMRRASGSAYGGCHPEFGAATAILFAASRVYRAALSVVRRAVEAVIALCDCAEDTTGQVTVSLDLNADWV